MRKAFALAAMFASLATVHVAASAAADEKDRRVVIQNESRQDIYYLYASPVSSETWEEDLLGNRTISPGKNVTADIDNGTSACDYDLKLVMKNGDEHVRRRVNVCVISVVTVTDSGASVR